MTTGKTPDELERDLRDLQAYDADPRRVERIRDLCLTALAARRRVRPVGHIAGWRRWLEPAAALALSVPYLVAAVYGSLALFR